MNNDPTTKKPTARASKAEPGDIVFAAQVRAARGLLGWSQQDLSERSGVARIVIARLEQGVSDPRFSTVTAVRKALAEAGVALFEDADGAYGVRRSAGGGRVG